MKKIKLICRIKNNKYGQKNPKFGKACKDAEEGYGALAQSQIIGNFLKRHGKTPKSLLLYPLVHAFPVPSLGSAVGAAGLYKGGQLGYRLAKSSALRTHYKNVLKEASKQNAAGMNRALKKLDEVLVKEDEKELSPGKFVLED